MKLFNKITDTLKRLTYTDWIFVLIIVYILKIVFSFASSYSIDIQGIEFAFLHYVQLLQKKQVLYSNPDAYPFYVIFYPPLYYYFIYSLIEILKINSFVHIHELLVFMRSISLLFTLLNGYIIFRILKLLSIESSKKIFLFLLYLLLITQHIFAARPDSIKLFFFLLFLLKALIYTFNEQKYSALLASSLYAALCIYLKHDAFLYILSYWLLYFIFFKKRNAIIAIVLLLFLILSGSVICYSHFGANFFRNILYYNLQSSADIRLNLMFILLNITRLSPFLFLCWKNFRSSNKMHNFLAALSLIYFFCSNLTMMRPGANLNYTYESVILMIINLAIYLHSNQLNWKLKYEVALIIFLAFLCPYLKLNPVIFNKKIAEKERTEYVSNLKDGDTFKDIIGTDTVFFTNPKYVIFNAQLNLIYGYDIHFDRYSELYFDIKLKPDIYSTAISKKYDEYFASGRVKYIVVEDSKKAIAQIGKFYPEYLYFRKVGNNVIYKYNKFI